MKGARPLVLDASAAVAFVAREDAGERVEGHLRSASMAEVDVAVPPFFWLEVVNALMGRRGWLGAQALEAVADLDAFDLVTVEHDRAMVLMTIDLVERHGLIGYDACYIALAIELDARLLTLDRRLAAAAHGRALPVNDSDNLAELREAYEREATWPHYRGASAFLARLGAEATPGRMR